MITSGFTIGFSTILAPVDSAVSGNVNYADQKKYKIMVTIQHYTGAHYILHIIHYTLHTTHYTLYTTHYTLHLTHYEYSTHIYSV